MYYVPLQEDGFRVIYALGETYAGVEHPFLFHNEKCGDVWIAFDEQAGEGERQRAVRSRAPIATSSDFEIRVAIVLHVTCALLLLFLLLLRLWPPSALTSSEFRWFCWSSVVGRWFSVADLANSRLCVAKFVGLVSRLGSSQTARRAVPCC